MGAHAILRRAGGSCGHQRAHHRHQIAAGGHVQWGGAFLRMRGGAGGRLGVRAKGKSATWRGSRWAG
jgi:hypothetical protein